MVCRVIIAALQIIEPGFYVVVIPTVAQGVPVGKGGAGGLLIHQAVTVSVRNANQLAPCIVGIGGVDLFRPANEISVGILHRQGAENFNHVALLVQRIEVCYVAAAIIGGILDCKGSALGIVGEDHDLGRAAAALLFVDYLAIQDAVLMLRIPYLFIGANAVGIVCIGGRLASGGNGGQLPPVFPGQAGVGRSVIPVFGIADLVIGNRPAVHRREQVPPVGIPVSIGVGGCAVGGGQNIACCVILVGISYALVIPGFREKLVLVIVGVASLLGEGGLGLVDSRNVPQSVVGIAVARDQAAVRHTVVKILRPGGGLAAGRVIRPCDGEQRAAAVRDGGLLQPPQRIIGEMQRLLRRCSEGGHAAVGGVVVGIIFRVGLAAERPRLPRQAVIAVVDVLRALHRAAVGVQLRAADQAAEGVVLEAVARKLARRIAVAQARK